MAGHSKWANIKRQKAAVDAKKGVVYAKMSREIIVAAKLGGGDPAANFRLRQAIDRAKAEGVPHDNIQRAIEKGSKAGGADNLEELTYEGYGPGGVAIMVRCATDNRNRTAGDVRMYFSKYGGNMGETGCVGWMFSERGEITVVKMSQRTDEQFLEAALAAGANDVELTQEDAWVAFCLPAELESVVESLIQKGWTVSSSELNMLPSNTIEVADREQARNLIRLLDNIENHDDVQKVYANFEMPPEWMQEFFN